MEFWKKRFATFEEATSLAFGHHDAGCEEREWSVECCSENLIAAWALLLSRFSGDAEITLGCEGLPLRFSIDESSTVAGFLESISTQTAEQLAHPITEDELREALGYPAGLALFESTVEPSRGIKGFGTFSDETLARIGGYLENLLAAFSDRDAMVAELNYLPAAAYEQLVRGWSPAPVVYPETCAHLLFEEVAAANSVAVALILDSERMTYGALNARANRIAHGLIARGVEPGQAVAMLLERGLDQIVVALAILKTGAAYVPLDPSLPPERIAQMLDDVDPPVVVSSVALGGTETLRVEELLAENEGNPGISVELDSLAYIIFTSGSTGRPKGVEVPHRGLVRLVRSAQGYIRLDENSVLLQMASVSFDVSVFEIWSMLLNGGALVLCPHKVPTIEQIGRLLEEHRVNTLLMTAAFFHLVVKEESHIFDPLEYLMVGGEALSAAHVEIALRELPNLCLMNAYGPTENSVNSTVHVFDRATFEPAAPVPIGRVVANTTGYILDRYQRPVPVGVPGELVVGGDGVARGYAARPDLTAQRFLPDPFSGKPGARMYRTGDLVYWNPKGEVEFIGRVDNQVKLRGFRLELGEIEATLAGHPQVEQAVVVLYEDEGRGKWLCGFVQVEQPETFDADALKVFALDKLPDYMVPTAWVPVKEWHFTPNGKIDRKALPKPSLEHVDEDVSYQTETESALAEIWQELLGLKTIPRTVGFFDLGGDSLKALTLFLKIHQRFGRDFTLATLLESPTIETLARVIADEPEGEQKSLKLIRRGDDNLPPMFWLHGGDGHVLLFKHFAENFDSNQTIYAFQYAGLDGRPGEISVEEMAQSYLKELLATHPSGRIRLGGFCIGGYVAMELARLLKKTAVEVMGPLVVVGSPNVRAKSFHPREPETSGASKTEFKKFCDKMAEVKRVPDAEIHRIYVPGETGWLKQTPLYGYIRRWRTWRRLMQMTDAARSGQPIDPASRGWYCGNITTLAGERHKSRGYDGDVLYFRSGVCHGSAMAFRGWWSNLFMGFDELCRGNFEGIVVGGLQEDLLKRPEVAAMVKDRFEANGN